MLKPDHSIGPAAQRLSELGQHLAFRPDGDGRQQGGSGRRESESATHGDRQSTAEAERAALLIRIDQEQAEITRAISAIRTMAPTANDPYLQALEMKASSLSAMRQQVESAGSLVELTQLRTQVAEAVRAAGENVQTVQGTTGVVNAAFTTRQLAEATFHARMLSVENTVNGLLRQDAQSFGQTAEMARRFGIDISPYHAERDALLREAEQKEKQGDRYGAITAKTLSVWNTYHTSQEVADAIDGERYPAEKAAAQRRADEDRARAERAEAEQRKAAEARAANMAEGKTFPGGPEERDAWIKAKVDGDMEAYEERRASMRKPKSLSEEQARSFDASISAMRRVAEAATSIDSSTTLSVDASAGSYVATRREEEELALRENPSAPYQHDAAKLPKAVQEQATQAAGPVAQDTANAQTKDGETKLPSSTPAVQVAEATKTTVTI